MHIEAFDSWEEAQATMGRYEDQANESLLDVQIALRDDTEHTRYWVRPYQEAGVLIFGLAWSWKDAAEDSTKHVEPRIGRGSAVRRMMELGMDDDVAQYEARYEESVDEAVWEIRTNVNSRQRGYLRGLAYSVIEPGGEYGSTHVSQVLPISKEAFDEAAASGWRAVDVDAFTLDLIGEKAARQGGWTPTLVKELAEHQKLLQQARAQR